MSKKAVISPTERRLEEATRWFVILQQPDLSVRALNAWKRWESVPENRQVFDELERLWVALDEIEPPAMPSHPAILEDDYDGSESVARWRARRQLKVTQSVPARAEVASPDAGSHRVWYYFAAAATLFVSIAAGFLLLRHDRLQGVQSDLQVFETAVGEHRDVKLGDGSTIQLGARSSLSVTMSERYRTVVLNSGEAAFSVAHDTARPFNVMAGNGMITAVGTAFNVRRRDDDQVVVTVTEGVVQVTPNVVDPKGELPALGASAASPRQQRLERGQQISYGEDGKLSSMQTVDDNAVTWHDGRLHYRQEPLRNIVPDINRYSRKPIVLGDRAAGDLLFTGTVFERDIDEWIDNLGSIYPLLEVTQTDANNVLIRTKPLTTTNK
jgi:transmembrane sensor